MFPGARCVDSRVSEVKRPWPDAVPTTRHVVFALVPSTNPLATVYLKVLCAPTTRNAIVISPHPAARACFIDATGTLRGRGVRLSSHRPRGVDWEWVETETARTPWRGMFVARGGGRSMEPEVHDGAWRPFASPVTGPRAGRVVLVRLNAALDLDTGRRFTVKRYRSEKAAGEEG